MNYISNLGMSENGGIHRQSHSIEWFGKDHESRFAWCLSFKQALMAYLISQFSLRLKIMILYIISQSLNLWEFHDVPLFCFLVVCCVRL